MPSVDKQMITYDNVDHMPFHDGEHLQIILKDIVSWMDYRG